MEKRNFPFEICMTERECNTQMDGMCFCGKDDSRGLYRSKWFEDVTLTNLCVSMVLIA